jgi:hypothetical protein
MLNNIRLLYRTHFSQYLIFRFLKHIALKAYWSLRNTVFAFRMLSSPRIFYRTYLARYWIFRLLKKILLAIYFRFPRVLTRLSQMRRRVKTFRLIPMRDFLTHEGIESILIESSKKIEIPGPKFVGNYPIELHRADVVRLDMPCIDVVEIPDATIVGGTNLILRGTWAIHPDLFVLSRDVMPPEMFSVASVDLGRGELNLRLPRRVKKMGRAISLLGQCTGNYAHWLTETLPKLLIVDALKEYEGLPLVVDEWIHPNFFDSIEIFNQGRRSIIRVARWEALTLTSVVEISPPSYVPYESRSHVERGEVHKPYPDVFHFSKFALDKLRNAAHDISPNKGNASRKLYLRRASESVGNGRLIANVKDAERLILAHGFEVIDPGKLDIGEQMAIFQDVECIISPVGAALANAIFTPAGCKIIALAPYYENANYYFFSNMMGVLEHELIYVLGPQVDMDGHAFHKDYSIDLLALNEALERVAR